MRAARVLAIAHRDLRAELAGRSGLALPLIAAGLLLPVALTRLPDSGVEVLPVQGDAPAEVLSLPGVRTDAGYGTGFREVDGALHVFAWEIPPGIRDALDAGDPVIRVETHGAPMPFPKRSTLFALISASTLTGAVSASVGGERTRNTLQALLSAAVSRLEIAAGKWLAWAGFGALAACTAGLGAVLRGTQEAGPWLLALPAVPALTVALALWLVRRTEDVIAGTSITLRVVPAVLIAAGLCAWGLSTVHPLLGAAVPLGGALLAAGDLWDGAWLPTAVALAVSAVATGALLFGFARDLEQHAPQSEPHRVRPVHALIDGGLTAGVWWVLLAGPVLWGWAGNAELTRLLGAERGLLAGSAMLGVFAGMRWARSLDPAERPRLGRPTWRAAVAALGLVAATALPAPSWLNPWVATAADRLTWGLWPGEAGVALAAITIIAQELWFRGWMQARAGWLPMAVAWAAVIAPHDPLAGLASGLLLGWAGRDGVLGSIAARLLAVAVVALTTA